MNEDPLETKELFLKQRDELSYRIISALRPTHTT